MRNISILLLLLIPVFSIAQISINEFSAHDGITDIGDECDWIEIINTSSSTINLSDFNLTDDPSDLSKWNMPDYDLAPSEIILLASSGLDITTKIDHWESLVIPEIEWSYFLGESQPPGNWTWETFNDTSWDVGIGGIGYGDGDDNTEIENVPSVYMRREFEIEDLENLQNLIFHPDFDDAYVAYINGTEFSRSNNIVGYPPFYNTYATIDQEALLYQDIIPTPIIFTPEEMESLLIEGTNVLAVQVHNATAFSSDMTANFYLSAGILNQEFNYFPTPSWFEGESANFYFHTSFKLSLDEEIIISDLAGSVVDSKVIDASLTLGISQGRTPDGTGPWCFFDAPTPTIQNGVSWCFEGITPKPTGLLESGWYDAEQSVNAVSDATIHYTINGDVPDQDDPILEDNLEFDSNTVLSLKAFSDDNLLPSNVLDRTYIFDEDNHSLPVFSIITDDVNLWDWDQGIYVSGDGASPDYPYFGSNFWQPWSKLSRLEYFDADKNKIAEEQLDLEIHGGWSRAEPQKSFRLDFKSKYTGRIEADFFTQKPTLTKFNNLNIRNGGQHLNADKMQDGLISRMVNETNVDNMGFQPCILYLNGEYWGMYEIREKIDENYVEDNHGVSSDNVDLMNSNGPLAGTDQHFNESYVLIMSEDPNWTGFYGMAAERFDLDNYMDYFIIETYIQNMDWMGIGWWPNNVKLWRPQTEDGKWRYVLYDTDAAYGYFGQEYTENYLAYIRNPTVSSAHSQIFDKLLENEQFKCEFTNRYADLMNTIFQIEHMAGIAEALHDEMVGGMQDHVDQWGAPGSVSDWQIYINSILDYADNRLPTARNHVETTLDLDGQVDITLEVFPEGAGHIKISTIIPETYPWEGVYYDGCDVQIVAIPNPGYTFENWSENDILGAITEEDLLTLNLFQSDIFTANFEEIPISVDESTADDFFEVFPNPSNGIFNVSLNEADNEIQSLSVYNSLGQMVLTKTFDQQSFGTSYALDLSNFNTGIYHLELKSAQKFYTKNIFLEK